MRSHQRSCAHAIVLVLVLGGSVLGPVGAAAAFGDEGAQSAATATDRTTATLAGPAAGGETSVTVDPGASGLTIGGSTIAAYSASHLSLLGPQSLSLEEQRMRVEGSLPPGVHPPRP